RLAIDRARVENYVTTKGGGVRSLSIRGTLTGFGADIIIIDDPVQIADCDDLEQHDWVCTIFSSEIETRLNDPNDGRIAVVAHRLHEHDLPGRLLRKGGW